MSHSSLPNDGELEAFILRAYPWWEMQRVRQLSFITSKAEPLQTNTWRHTSLLIDHNYRGVTTPNCDTLYSGAWLDLAHGPVLIEVPATDLPYWSIAAMDLHTDNIAVLGSRYPNSQSLLVCAEDYAGDLPTDITCVRSKTQVVWLLARYLIGTEDLVRASETLRRAVILSKWPVKGSIRLPANTPLRIELVPAFRKNAQNFWEIVCATFTEDPALFKALTVSGLSASLLAPINHCKPWADLSADFQAQFTKAFEKTLAIITANNSGNMQTLGQWRYPGADIGNFGNNAMYRAEVALWGLGALETKEVMYVSTFTDTTGAMLTGAKSYKFTIPPEGIPALAFWSLTMYEVDPYGGMYFTGSKINRYAIGDRTQGLQPNVDGSIDIWIAHQEPTNTKQLANWLPAPAGLFKLMLRVYAPKKEFQTAEVFPPSVTECPSQ
jgi:hypothetical protein